MHVRIDINLPSLPRRRGRCIGLLAVLTLALVLPGLALASHQFTDVPDSNPFHNDIAAIADAGVTSGCGGGKYCPKDPVTREQMAAFMNRLGALSPGKTPVVNADKLDGLDSTAFMAGYEVVSETQSAADDRSFHSVDCPPGKVPIGGGWHDVYNDTASIASAGQIGPISSFPTATGWSFTYWNVVSAHDVTFYVICATTSS